TAISTLSLHDALPISGKNRTAARSTKLMTGGSECRDRKWNMSPPFAVTRNEVFRRRHHEGTLPSIGHPFAPAGVGTASAPAQIRSEEHTSELQSRRDL